MTRAVEEVDKTLGRLIAAPAPRLNTPAPLGCSLPLPVLGLRARPSCAPEAVMLALTLTLFEAVRVRIVPPVPPFQLMASLTLMLPLPLLVPWLDRMVTLLLFSAALSVAPEMSPLGEPSLTVPPLPEAMVKSFGSISQVPVFPPLADVSTLAVSAILTVAAEVSIAPPSPCVPRASSWPSTRTWPCPMSAST